MVPVTPANAFAGLEVHVFSRSDGFCHYGEVVTVEPDGVEVRYDGERSKFVEWQRMAEFVGTYEEVAPVTRPPQVELLTPQVEPLSPQVEPLPLSPLVVQLPPKDEPLPPQVEHVSPQMEHLSPQVEPLSPQVEPLPPQVEPLSPQVEPLTPKVEPLPPQVEPLSPAVLQRVFWADMAADDVDELDEAVAEFFPCGSFPCEGSSEASDHQELAVAQALVPEFSSGNAGLYKHVQDDEGEKDVNLLGDTAADDSDQEDEGEQGVDSLGVNLLAAAQALVSVLSSENERLNARVLDLEQERGVLGGRPKAPDNQEVVGAQVQVGERTAEGARLSERALDLTTPPGAAPGVVSAPVAQGSLPLPGAHQGAHLRHAADLAAGDLARPPECAPSLRAPVVGFKNSKSFVGRGGETGAVEGEAAGMVESELCSAKATLAQAEGQDAQRAAFAGEDARRGSQGRHDLLLLQGEGRGPGAARNPAGGWPVLRAGASPEPAPQLRGGRRGAGIPGVPEAAAGAG